MHDLFDRPPTSNPDVTRNFHRDNPQSAQANTKLGMEGKHHLRGLILQYIENQGERGATCEEIERSLTMKHQTASARLTELKAEGSVLVAGRRQNASGSTASVYVLKPQPQEVA